MTTEQLIAALDNGADAERVAAAQALATLDPSAVASQAAALARHASDETVAEWCVAALEELGPPPTDSIAALTALLSGPADTSYWAATLLGRLGPDAAAAVGSLADTAASDAALPSRERAVWALKKIGPAAEQALPVLERLSQSEHARLSRLAEQAIEAIKA